MTEHRRLNKYACLNYIQRFSLVRFEVTHRTQYMQIYMTEQDRYSCRYKDEAFINIHWYYSRFIIERTYKERQLNITY